MKKVLSILVLVLVIFGIVGCGSKESSNSNGDKKIVKVGVTPVPHKEIMEKVKPILEKEGYKLEIVEFNDYTPVNIALNEGELDANFFQHIPYLNEYNKKQNGKLLSVAKVHLEPMGIYSNKIKKISEIKNGSEVIIPNEASNGSRALKLLEKEGLIKLKNLEIVSPMDIIENKKNLKIKELDPAQLPRVLNDVDFGVINTNFAIQAKLDPMKDAIAIESKDSPYANIIAIKESDKNKPHINALIKAVNSPKIKKFIQDNYKGRIIPAF